jgi:hypothetical protein
MRLLAASEAQTWAFQKVKHPRRPGTLHLLTHQSPITKDQLITNFTNITSHGVKHQRLKHPSPSSPFVASPPSPSNKMIQTRCRPPRCTRKGYDTQNLTRFSPSGSWGREMLVCAVRLLVRRCRRVEGDRLLEMHAHVEVVRVHVTAHPRHRISANAGTGTGSKRCWTGQST